MLAVGNVQESFVTNKIVGLKRMIGLWDYENKNDVSQTTRVVRSDQSNG